MNDRPLRVLVVEDDEAIGAGLALNLRIEGYEPRVEQDGASALEAVRESAPDLVVLDIGLPNRDGLSVLSEMRRSGDHTPVIVLSARQEEFDKVAALRLGADDYVTKPFALAELLARIGAVLRRSGRAPTSVEPLAPAPRGLGFADVSVDPATRTVAKAGAPVKLTHLELELLLFFVQNPARVISRPEILRAVWGVSTGSARTVDNFVAQLRTKLGDDAESPRHFVTVRGSGYRFDP